MSQSVGTIQPSTCKSFSSSFYSLNYAYLHFSISACLSIYLISFYLLYVYDLYFFIYLYDLRTCLSICLYIYISIAWLSFNPKFVLASFGIEFHDCSDVCSRLSPTDTDIFPHNIFPLPIRNFFIVIKENWRNFSCRKLL